jgi:hypothetical protein
MARVAPTKRLAKLHEDMAKPGSGKTNWLPASP